MADQISSFSHNYIYKYAYPFLLGQEGESRAWRREPIRRALESQQWRERVSWRAF
jgi:hypothetical protein